MFKGFRIILSLNIYLSYKRKKCHTFPLCLPRSERKNSLSLTALVPQELHTMPINMCRASLDASHATPRTPKQRYANAVYSSSLKSSTPQAGGSYGPKPASPWSTDSTHLPPHHNPPL